MNITAEQSTKKIKEVPNTNKVPLKLWRTFKTDAAKKMYNTVYERTLHNQAILVHPKAVWVPDLHWTTICHNFACIAVWELLGDPGLKKGTVVKDIVTKTGRVVKKYKAK